MVPQKITRLIFTLFVVTAILNSAPILTDLEEVIDSDPFFSFFAVDLRQRVFPSRTLEYSVHKGFHKKVASAPYGGAEVSRFSQEFLHPRLPLKLWDYLIENEYEVEIHFGTVEESLFYLHRQGYGFTYKISTESGNSTEILMVPPGQAEELRSGVFILTGIEDRSILEQLQIALQWTLKNSERLELTQTRVVDFHLISRESYEASRFKEVFHSLPPDLELVLGGEGEAIFRGLLSRKFSAMSLSLLQGLFGKEFLLPLKRSLIEEGYLGLQDWNIQRFLSLENNDSNLLATESFLLFSELQRELVLALAQSPQKPLSKILLSGNELAIHKELLLRRDLSRKLELRSNLSWEEPLFAALLPIKNSSGTKRMLFTGKVYGQSLRSLYKVLSHVGIQDFFHAGTVYSLSENLNPGDLFVPVTLKGATKLKVDAAPLSREKVQKLSIKHGLSGSYSLVPGSLSSLNSPQDFQDDHFYPAVDFLSQFSGRWQVLGLCLEDPSGSPLLSWRKNRVHFQALVEAIRLIYDIEDIQFEMKEEHLTFPSMQEKIAHLDHQFNLDPSNSVLFHFALEDYFSRWLENAQEKEAYLKTGSFEVPTALSGDPFTYFLTRPFQDQDVLAHILQIEKALFELKTYLQLMQEEEVNIQIHGEFLNATFTPLTPLMFSLEGISQKGFAELLSSPFGGSAGSRKFLLRLIPTGKRPTSEHDFQLQSLEEGFLVKQYLEILLDVGISPSKENGFKRSSVGQGSTTDTLNERAQRWVIGCEAYLQLARSDFLREKSQVFSQAPWSQERVSRLTDDLRTGVVRLAAEGLEIKEAISSVVLDQNEKEELYALIMGKISDLEEFVRVFEAY